MTFDGCSALAGDGRSLQERFFADSSHCIVCSPRTREGFGLRSLEWGGAVVASWQAPEHLHLAPGPMPRHVLARLADCHACAAAMAALAERGTITAPGFLVPQTQHVTELGPAPRDRPLRLVAKARVLGPTSLVVITMIRSGQQRCLEFEGWYSVMVG